MKENDKKENIINTNLINDYNPPTLENNLQSHLIISKNLKKNLDIINGTYSNDVSLIENCEEFSVKVSENKRLRGIILYNSTKLSFTVLDSAVIMTRTIRAINCNDSVIVISDADIRRVELWGCKNTSIYVFCQQVQAENIFILIHHDCENITLKYGELKVDMKDFHPYNEILNEVKVPNIENNDDNKIILARCVKVPLFEINIFEKIIHYF